jgi:hypothetical protein
MEAGPFCLFPPKSGKTHGAGLHRQASSSHEWYKNSALNGRQGAVKAKAVIGLFC